MYPGEDPPLQFDIFAVHVAGVRADTGRPVRTTIPHVLPSVRRDTTPANVKKKARVKTLVILPVPVPENASSYELEACFDVAPSGDGKLLSWTRSRDMDYNSKVKKSLDRYLFWPATLNGVAVRDTLCLRAKTARPPGH